MRVVKVIQPHEFGDNFILEDGKWKVKFPPIATSGVEVSKDANNLITLGTDGGMFVDATRIHAYALVQDNENMKIHLYRYQANVEFDIATATLINSIDMLELNGQFDDITITDAVVTFKDVQTDTELEFDTNQFQNVEELSFDWPLSPEKDDKLKVGATDRIEVTMNLATNKNERDWVRFNIYDIGKESILFDYKYAGSNQDIANVLNANIDPDKHIMFELVSLVEVGQLTEVKLAFINTSNEDRHLEFKFNPYTNGLFGLEYENVLAEVTGTPSYEWYSRQGNNAALHCYLAAKDTVIEDNGISPTASVIDLYIPTYIYANSSENALVKTPEGLLVLPTEGVHIDHTLEAHSYQVDVPNDEIEIEEFVRTINGNEIRMPAVTLKNLRGKTLGAIVAPISEKLPIPTTDRITIDTNTSVLDSRVLINGVDKGSFVDLSLNQIPELQFTLISVSSYSGGDGYVDGGYEVDPYNEGSYSGDGYNDSYGSYGGDGYTIETEGYQFIVRNNTQKRLRVTIDGFNAINLTAHSDGINSLALGSNKIGFDLAPRFVDEVNVYFAFCNEDGVALSMAERDVLHEGGSSVNLIATYLNYNNDAPIINVSVDGYNQPLYAGNTTLFNVTLPSIDDCLNLYYRPEIEVTSANGLPINAPIYIDAIAVKGMNSMPPMTVTSGGLSIPYACEESAWNNTFNYVYRPVEGNDKAIVSSGREFSINLHPRFANMDVIYDPDDVPSGQQQIGKLDNSGSINFTTKQLIPRTDSDAIIGIRDNSIDKSYINIAVNRM